MGLWRRSARLLLSSDYRFRSMTINCCGGDCDNCLSEIAWTVADVVEPHSATFLSLLTHKICVPLSLSFSGVLSATANGWLPSRSPPTWSARWRPSFSCHTAQTGNYLTWFWTVFGLLFFYNNIFFQLTSFVQLCWCCCCCCCCCCHW